MSGPRLRVTLLGTGSSGGVPRIGNDWGACDPSEPRNRRRRCSILVDRFEVAAPERLTRVLVDRATDLREQLLDARVARLDAVLFTHDHADQTHGIDDLRALVLAQRAPLPAYLDGATHATLYPKFQYCFEGQGGYPPILTIQDLLHPLVPVTVSGAGGDLTALPLDQEHGRIRSLGFRFGPLAYCNDVNALPEETFEALEGVDTLILDALRYTPHPTHAHLDRSLEWIARIGPRRAILTNMHIDLDYATLCASLPAGVEPGYDGQVVELSL